MDPETIDDDRRDNLIQRSSTQEIAGHLKRIEQLEEEVILDLQQIHEVQDAALERIEQQQIHEAQGAALDRLVLLKQQRKYFTELLDWEGERLIRQNNADWDAAQARNKVENFDRNHLVGYFVRVRSWALDKKGIVTERHSLNKYNILFLDGKLESILSHQFNVLQPTNEEEQIIRNLGYSGPSGKFGQLSYI